MKLSFVPELEIEFANRVRGTQQILEWGCENVPEELINELIERNLIIYDLYPRDPVILIDESPLEKDPELGIGKYIAKHLFIEKLLRRLSMSTNSLILDYFLIL